MIRQSRELSTRNAAARITPTELSTEEEQVAMCFSAREWRFMQCGKCGNFGIRRSERRGFLEKRIYPVLGCFPWICSGCNARFLRMSRGEKRGSD